MAQSLNIAHAAQKLSNTRRLEDSVFSLKYVSEDRGQTLAKLGIEQVRDLFWHIPRRYLDLSSLVGVGLAPLNEDVSICVEIVSAELKEPKPRFQILELAAQDPTGVVIVSLFRQPWLKDKLVPGTRVIFRGKMKISYGFRRMSSPVFEVIEEDGSHTPVLPVYGLTDGMSIAWMRRIMSSALETTGEVVDPIPAHMSSKLTLMTRSRALRSIHFPQSIDEAEAARRRLAYDELLCLQLALKTRQALTAEDSHTCHVVGGPHQEALIGSLPFTLTDEQSTAIHEILNDMAAPSVMNRLLQGDVGTGKTIVAAICMAACADSGTQAACMAPTSVLAAQYEEKLGPLFAAAHIRSATITSATPADVRANICEELAQGKIDVLFGTTALLSPDVIFHNLSLIVIDEQHRFGVSQRAHLREKGQAADVLAMTATPIPRTLALSIYGDVDVSKIASRPFGTKRTTKQVTPENMDLAWGALRDTLARGEQAYIVCPLIAGDKDDDVEALSMSVSDAQLAGDDVPEAFAVGAHLWSAEETARYVQTSIAKDARIGVLTGQMKPAEKDKLMEQFRSHKLDVLVSTTVVEVGVDVPQATYMLIRNADRFGLATLHQLRGRVGRGKLAGQVFLESAAKRGSVARRRLHALETSDDGFKLAQLDLDLRREGDVLGLKQAGSPALRIADMSHDEDLIEAAYMDARAILTQDRQLLAPEHALLRQEVYATFGSYIDELGKRVNER